MLAFNVIEMFQPCCISNGYRDIYGNVQLGKMGLKSYSYKVDETIWTSIKYLGRKASEMWDETFFTSPTFVML